MTFSIIIPAYNTEQCINKCVLSVLQQDYPCDDFEVIVVDDCSPDNLADRVIALQNIYNNLKLVRHEINKKQGGARNTGIKSACGEWILFLDSDDYWQYSNTLSIFKQLIIGHVGISVMYSISHRDEYFDIPNNMRRFVGNKMNAHFETVEEYFMSGRNALAAYVWRGCYRKDYLIEFPFRENVQLEDGDWCIKVLCQSRQLLVCDFPFYVYYDYKQSTCRTPRISVFQERIICNEKMMQYIQDVPNISEKTRAVLFSLVKKNIYIFPKLSRDYKLRESKIIFNQLSKSILMNTALYVHNSYLDYCFFWILKYMPILIYFPIRVLVLFKRRVVNKAFLVKSK